LILVIGIFSWNLASDALFLHKVGFEGFERGEDIKEFILLKSMTRKLFIVMEYCQEYG